MKEVCVALENLFRRRSLAFEAERNQTLLWLGRDTEANEIIVATADGVVKVRIDPK